MASIFDIEEKLNKKIDRDYLISNGWRSRIIAQFGEVYTKTIRHENRSSLFTSFYYHYKTTLLKNGYTRESIEVDGVIDLELIISDWHDEWIEKIDL